MKSLNTAPVINMIALVRLMCALEAGLPLAVAS